MVTTTLYARQQKKHSYKNRLLDSVEEGEGGMFWENSIETCILSYVKYMTSPSLMHKTGPSKPVHWDNPEGWDGREGGGGLGMEGGTHAHPQLIHIIICKNHHNIVK